MDQWLKIGGIVVVGAIALWVVWWIMNVIFSIVTTIVSIAVTLAIAAILLYLAYLVLSALIGGDSSSGSTSTERDRIYE